MLASLQVTIGCASHDSPQPVPIPDTNGGTRPPPAGGPPSGPFVATPEPTEVARRQDEAKLNRERQQWIESLHRAAPGTDWRLIERANWRRNLAARNAIRRARLGGQAAPDPLPWIEVGSLNLAGRTHQAAFSTSTNQLYLGSNLGGLWRGDFDPADPDPGAMNWQPLSDGVYGSAFQVLVLDGPPVTLLKTHADAWSSQIHRSTDAGATWTLASGVTGRVRRMLKLRNAEETVFAVADTPNNWVCGSPTTTQLLRSRDRGATFGVVSELGGSRADIWAPRTAPGPLYQLTDNRLDVSADLGGTWTTLGTLPWTGPSRVALTASEAGGPTFYTIVQKNDCSGPWTMFRSDDGGSSWVQTTTVNDFWGDMVSLSASTTDAGLVLYGGLELWRSTDGGGTFAKVNNWYDYYGDPAHKLHADIPSIDFAPVAGGGEILFVATDGGTFSSANGGATFENISMQGLKVSQYYSTLSDAGDPRRIQGGSQDQGFQSGEAGQGLAFNQLISGDYGHLTSSNGTHDLVYSAYPGFILIAEANGSSPRLYQANFPPEDHHWLPCLVADPLDPDSVYLCAEHLYKYTRSGDSWTGTQLPFDFGAMPGEYVSAFAIARSDPDRRYAATNAGRLFYSSDAGASWTRSGFASTPPPQYLTGLAILVDPVDSSRVYVGGSGYSNPPVFVSSDGGETFAPLQAGLPSTLVYDLAADVSGGGDLYAATESGPYRYDSDLGAWQSLLGDSAPMTIYWSVEAAFDRVRFGTYGRGIWDYVPAQAGCTFSLSPTQASFSEDGGTAVLHVAAGAGCAWSAMRLDDWIELTGTTKGTGSGSVDYSVAAATAPGTRTGHITVQGQELVVTQSDAAFPVVEFDVGSYTVAEAGSQAIISVSRTGGGTGSFTVAYATSDASATAGADYTATGGVLSFGANLAKRTFAVPVAKDTSIEGDEALLLDLSSPGGAILGGRSTALLTIVDDESGSAIRFGKPAYAVGESLPTAKITVTRTGGAGGPVTVDYATSDGTAESPGDYASSAGTLTFAAGQISQTLTVPIVSDALDESNETLAVTLGDPTGGATLGSPSAATLTITDNDAGGVLQLSLTSLEVDEAAGTASLTVTRTGGSAGGVSVSCTPSDGSATGGADYDGAAQLLSFGAGVMSQSCLVPILDDALAEGAETLILTLGDATGGASLGAKQTAVVTITDDEPVTTLHFGSLLFTSAEGGKGSVTVKRSGPAAGALTVDYATSDGTALLSDSDYAASGGTLSFAANVTTRTFVVLTTADTRDESDEDVNLTLSNPSGGAVLGTQSGAKLLITDNDAGGALRFSSATYSRSEAFASALVTVKRTGGTAGGVTIDYATSDGTATAGLDYTASSGTLSFAAGQSSRTFSMAIAADTLDEADETVNLTLSNATGGAALGSPATATLTLLDEDTDGVLQFSLAGYGVDETGGGATITVTRSGGKAGPLTVDYQTSDAGAQAGSDYTPASGTLSFAAGVLSQSFSVAVLDDAASEGNESVNLALANPSGNASLGPRSAALLTITDADGVTLHFGSPVFTVGEGGVGIATVTRSGPATSAVTVDYATSDGTATTADSDYSARAGTLSFGPHVKTRTFMVPTTTDTRDEPDEDVNLTLSNPTGGALLGTQSTATLAIADNDAGGAVHFSSAAYGGSEALPSVTITVKRTGGTASAVTVDYATSDGTATAPADYTSGTGTLTFAAGQKSRTFTVGIVEDALDEGNETLNLTLGNPSGGSTLGDPATATLAITDDDVAGLLQFSASSYAVGESGGTATITLTRTGGSAGAVTVDYATSDGTAVAGADYLAVSGTLAFEAFETTKTLAVTIHPDADAEPNETILLTLGSPGGGGTLGSRSTATLYIVDDE